MSSVVLQKAALVGVAVGVRAGVGVGKKVGFPVAETPIRVIFWVGLKVPNIDPNAHRKAIATIKS